MSRSTTALKRLGVPGLAAVTLVAGLPLFLGTAQAATGDTITLSPASQTAPAGTCDLFTVAYSSTTDNKTVTFTATPRSALQDVRFCSVDANGDEVVLANDFGPGLNSAETYPVTDADADENQSFTVGIAADQVGTVDLIATLADGTESTTDNATDSSTEIFTAGFTPAVTRIDAEPENAFDVESGNQEFTVTAFNSAGAVVPGASVYYEITAGPDDVNAVEFCDTTNQNGEATCTITNAGGPGTDTIIFFADTDGAEDRDTGEPADTVSYAITEPEAAGTTVTLTCADNRTTAAGDVCQNPLTDTTEVFSALVKNAAGTPVSGAVVNFELTVNTDGDADTLTAAQAAESLSVLSGRTDANGVLTTTLSNVTTNQDDSFGVNASIVTAGGLVVDDSATKIFHSPTGEEARTLTLTPESATKTTGDAQAFTATVVDRFGNPVAGVQVTFAESGTGRFPNGSSTAVVLTNAAGVATAEVISNQGETPGANTVTATITGFTNEANELVLRNPGTANDECELPVNRTFGNDGGAGLTTQPGIAAGDCDDTATVNFVSATASPSPSASTSPSTSPSATPTAGTCTPAAQVTIIDTTIIATGAGRLSVDAPANSIIELEAYTRPSTTYRVVRRAEINAAGDDAQFLITPPANTRLRARVVGCAFGDSKVMNVRTALSLFAKRNGVRNYTFSGDSLPARPGGLIISLYRVTASGSQVLTSQVRANATNGEWSLTRQFTGSGRFGFVVRTGQDLQNAPGSSNVRPTLIY